MEQVQEPKYERSAKSTKLTAFHETIVTALKVDARRPKRERRTALALFEQIKGEGYEGCYSRLTDFIRAWRASHAQSGREAFVPLSFEWGEAFQFDWSDEGLVIGGVYRKLQLAHMKLCASRAFWLTAYPGQRATRCSSMHTPADSRHSGSRATGSRRRCTTISRLKCSCGLDISTHGLPR